MTPPSTVGPPPAAATTPDHRITRGGPPTDTQAAVIAAVLAELERADAADAADAETARGERVPAWARAALAEGTTGVTITTPQEL